VPPYQTGQRCTCPRCGAEIVVPDSAAPSPAQGDRQADASVTSATPAGSVASAAATAATAAQTAPPPASAAAPTPTAPKPAVSYDDVYGITLRGRAAQTTSRVAPIIAEFGGAWEDLDGNPAIATPEAIAGISWYGDMLRLYGPPGAANLAWPDSNAIFLGGKAVFTIEDSVNAARALDPALSVIGDTIGFAAMPLGPGGLAARSNDPCTLPAIWALSMSSFSDSKGAAWYFIQWATSTENQIAYLERGRPAARDSAFFSDEFAVYRNANLPEYWDVLLEATATLCYRNPQFGPPSIVDQGRARDIIGEVVVTAILGGDVPAAARAAQEELEFLKARQ